MIVVFHSRFHPIEYLSLCLKEITDFSASVFCTRVQTNATYTLYPPFHSDNFLLPRNIRLRDLLVCILAAINNYSKSAGFLQLMSVKIGAILY